MVCKRCGSGKVDAMSEQTPHIVVVTGASGGIGRASARAFGRRGDTVVLLARGEPIQLRRDDLGSEELPHRAPRHGSAVEWTDRLVLGATFDRDDAARRHMDGELLDESSGSGFSLVHGVEEHQREGQLERVRGVCDLLNGIEAVPHRRREPRMRGDGRVVAGHLQRDSGDDRGDLQR
jgi:NAD(P)-dependent dehydrogenase (short-subunit alcohol dehydrogenase family)